MFTTYLTYHVLSWNYRTLNCITWQMFSIITTTLTLFCKKNDSPKSMPSETFPLATDNRIAPRPFSHA